MFKKIKELLLRLLGKNSAVLKQTTSRVTLLWLGEPKQTPKF